jgi:hypothetical protein
VSQAQIWQQATPLGISGSGTSITSNPLPGASVVGSVIKTWLAIGANTPTVLSVVDSNTQTHLLIGTRNSTADNSYYACYYYPNNQYSGTGLTVTATYGQSNSARNIQVQELIKCFGTAPDTSNFPVRIVTPGTGTNAISVALTSTGTNGGLILGVCAAVEGSGNIQAGTGFTAGPSWQNGAGFSHSLFVSGTLGPAGSNPCLWTDPTDGASSTYLAMAVVWDNEPSTTSDQLLASSNNGGF